MGSKASLVMSRWLDQRSMTWLETPPRTQALRPGWHGWVTVRRFQKPGQRVKGGLSLCLCTPRPSDRALPSSARFSISGLWNENGDVGSLASWPKDVLPRSTERRDLLCAATMIPSVVPHHELYGMVLPHPRISVNQFRPACHSRHAKYTMQTPEKQSIEQVGGVVLCITADCY